MTTVLSLVKPSDPCMFTGYRNLLPANRPDIYQSIGHWFESEKFRSTNEAIRQEVLQQPTAKEARKLAGRHADEVRSNWRSIRARVLRAGFLMAAKQNRSVAAIFSELARLTSLEIGTLLDPAARLEGYEMSFYGGVQWEAAELHVHHPSRLLLACSDKATYASKKAAIDKQLAGSVISEVIVPIAKGASAIGEEYALFHNLPVTYMDAPRGKIDLDLAEKLVDMASQAVVLEKKGGKTFDTLIVQAKEKGKAIKLVLV